MVIEKRKFRTTAKQFKLTLSNEVAGIVDRSSSKPFSLGSVLCKLRPKKNKIFIKYK